MVDVVAESDDLVVVNKPGDLVCHPTKAGPESSLIGRLRWTYRNQPEVEPRFVNRLDRETSGLVVISKNRAAHKRLCRELESARKFYWAVVRGCPGESGTIDQPLGKALNSPVVVKQAVVPGGKPSRTHWKLLSQADEFSLLELELETGRMHQLRVHLAWLGHPIVGDKLYGPDETLYLDFVEQGWTQRHDRELLAPRQLLSALRLETQEHSWGVDPPSDILSFRSWEFRGEGSK